MSSGSRRELRLIRISRREGAPAAGTGGSDGTPQVPQRRQAHADQMSMEDLIDNIPFDDLRRMMDAPMFSGPPPTPAEVSPSQVSPSHPIQQGGRGRGWFPSMQILRRRGRSRRPAPSTPPLTHAIPHSSPHLPSHAMEGDLDHARVGSQGAAAAPQPLEGELLSSAPFRARFPRSRAIRHIGGQEELDDFWMSVDFENDAREIEAAMQSILMDGIAGALQARGRRRQHMWLSEDEDRWTYEELLELDADNVRRGLKQKEFNKLERSQQRSSDPKLDCQICMSETCPGDDITKLPCSHAYHEMCITPWLRSHRTCPVCRYEFPG